MTTEQVIWILNNLGDSGFYLHPEWRAKRQQILDDQHHECQECRKRGRITTATIVHHVKHLREFPELAFEDSNLEAVCSTCHNVLHPEKLRKYTKKKRKEWNDERW